jgi:hypothetical protein
MYNRSTDEVSKEGEGTLVSGMDGTDGGYKKSKKTGTIEDIWWTHFTDRRSRAYFRRESMNFLKKFCS